MQDLRQVRAVIEHVLVRAVLGGVVLAIGGLSLFPHPLDVVANIFKRSRVIDIQFLRRNYKKQDFSPSRHN